MFKVGGVKITKTSKTIFGQNLKRLREEKGVQQKDVADFLGVSVPAYSGWERGRTEPPFDKLMEIARYFDARIDNLLIRSRITLRIGHCMFNEYEPLENVGIGNIVNPLVYEHLFYTNLPYSNPSFFLVEIASSIYPEKKSTHFYPLEERLFHDKSHLTADDIKNVYDKLLEENPHYKEVISSAEAPHPMAFQLNLNSSANSFEIPLPFIMKKSGDNYVGTGPFKIGKNEHRLITLINFDDYPKNEYGAVRSIEIIRCSTPEQLEEMLVSGLVDIAIGIKTISDKYNSRIAVSDEIYYLVFNMNSALCTNESFRYAVYHAIDIEGIKEKFNGCFPSNSLGDELRKMTLDYDNKQYDPEKARNQWERLKEIVSNPIVRIGSHKPIDYAHRELIVEVVNELNSAGIPAKVAGKEANFLVGIERIAPDPRLFKNYSPELYEALKNINIAIGEEPWRKNLLRKIEDFLRVRHIAVPLFYATTPVSYTENFGAGKGQTQMDYLFSTSPLNRLAIQSGFLKNEDFRKFYK